MASEGPDEHRVYEQHTYEGMVLCGDMKASNLDRVKHFQFRGDVVVASYPKTGTTWLQEMTWLVMNDGDMDAANQKETFRRVPFLEYTDRASKAPMVDVINTLSRPVTINTHLPVKFFSKQLADDDVKFLVIVRNPKDMLVSYYHFYQCYQAFQFFKGTWDEFFELFTKKRLMSGDYFEWYKNWWQFRDHPKVMFMKYEDMKEDLPREIRRIASFLNKGISSEVLAKIAAHGDFNAMKNNKMTNWSTMPGEYYKPEVSQFIRSGKVGEWKKFFTKEQSDIIDGLYASELEANGLYLKFD